MYFSPPITALLIMASIVAATAWLVPPQPKAERATLMLPTATYKKLALWGREHADTHGQSLTVVQVIEALAEKWEKDNEALRNSGEAARKKKNEI